MAQWRKRLFIATSYITADAAERFGLPRDRTVIMGSRIEVLGSSAVHRLAVSSMRYRSVPLSTRGASAPSETAILLPALRITSTVSSNASASVKWFAPRPPPLAAMVAGVHINASVYLSAALCDRSVRVEVS